MTRRQMNKVSQAVKLNGQSTNKPTCSQSSCRLVNSHTSQLANSEFLKIMELLHYICTLNLDQTLKPIDYWQCTNCVIYPKSHLQQWYTPRFKSNISASWLVRELSSTWLTSSWFVSELSGYHQIPASMFQSQPTQ